MTLNHVDFCLNIQWHTSVPKAQPVAMHRNSSITACWQSSWPRQRFLFNRKWKWPARRGSGQYSICINTGHYRIGNNIVTRVHWWFKMHAYTRWKPTSREIYVLVYAWKHIIYTCNKFINSWNTWEFQEQQKRWHANTVRLSPWVQFLPQSWRVLNIQRMSTSWKSYHIVPTITSSCPMISLTSREGQVFCAQWDLLTSTYCHARKRESTQPCHLY